MSASARVQTSADAHVLDEFAPSRSRGGGASFTRPSRLAGPAAVDQREAIYKRLLASADSAAIASALIAMVLSGTQRLSLWTALVPAAMVVIAKVAGLYDRDELLLRRSTLDEVPRLFHLSTLVTLVLWLGQEAFLNGAPLTTSQVLVLWVVLLGGLMVLRWTARLLAGLLAPAERCLFIGDAAMLERLRGKVEHDRAVELLGAVPLERMINDFPQLREMALRRGAHRLIIAPTTAGTHEETMNLIRGAKATGLRVSILPGILEVVGSSVEFDHLPGMTLLGVKSFGLSRSSEWSKRGFDLLGSSVALALLWPLMLLIALLIRLGSPGPVLFRQTRVGRGGRTFSILKFRTMVDGADAMRADLAHRNEAVGGLFKITDDPRITRVGTFLRKTSLDELPQLINVLRGEMALVGPRPLVVYEDERVTGFDRRRLALTPGITGPWQIAGSARVPLSEMVKLDYVYVAGWSLWNDVKICLRTGRYVLARRGQ
jgi:exopolysaccharide biosynthesis polyprenyl glycosylphosphotransferase